MNPLAAWIALVPAVVGPLPGDFVRCLSFAQCGDANADGAQDFAIGLPRDDTHGVDAGRVFVISGKDGSVLREFSNKVPYSGFGFGLATGDFDADGTADLVVSSHRDGFLTVPPGVVMNPRVAIRIYSLKSGEMVKAIEIPQHLGLGILACSVVNTVGDVDSDGAPDVLALHREEALLDGGWRSPATLFSGRTGELLRSLPFERGVPSLVGDLDGDRVRDLALVRKNDVAWAPVHGTSSFTELFERECREIADLGDLNGDGRPELALTLPCATGGSYDKIVVISKGEQMCEISQDALKAIAVAKRWGDTGCPRLEICGAPDVDGDGVGEVIVALPSTFGAVALMSGRTGSLVWKRLGTEEQPLGLSLFDYDTQDIGRVADCDGDGCDDLAIAATGASTSEPFESVGAHVSILSSRDGARLVTMRVKAEQSPEFKRESRPAPKAAK
jgi:hypothetical protein